MRPVHQTTFYAVDSEDHDPTRGNCLQAAIASVLELPLEEVPHFVALPQNEWWPALFNWFHDRGILVNYERIQDDIGRPIPGAWAPLGIPYLLAGPSPRGEFSHVVVAMNHEVIHDPHPDATGLAPGWRGVYYFLVADPARVAP